jgi:hypothetical protein
MGDLDAGDLVRANGESFDMLVIGRADDAYWDQTTPPAVFCVWERAHFLHEKVFEMVDLILIRKERRRIVRGGCLNFPTKFD